MPTPEGPLDDFTRAEKAATKSFMVEAGYGTSTANQRRCRRLWKGLSDMRGAGVDKLLMYRTKEFDTFCKEYPDSAETSLINTILSWETVYASHISLLEERVRKEAEGDRTGRTCLNQPHISGRLQIPEESWSCGDNKWFSNSEVTKFRADVGFIAASSEQLGGILDIDAEGSTRNKAVFVCYSMDFIASALGSIPALVWGERAIAYLGVRIVCDVSTNP